MGGAMFPLQMKRHPTYAASLSNTSLLNRYRLVTRAILPAKPTSPHTDNPQPLGREFLRIAVDRPRKYSKAIIALI